MDRQNPIGMQEILRTIRNRVRVKNDLSPGDIILVGMPAGLIYGKVHSIEPDVKRGWHRLDVKLFMVPPVDVSWILRRPQMAGEIFTIDDQEHFVLPVDTSRAHPETHARTVEHSHLRLIPRKRDT